jgi:putative heme-binding domain-containing protein
MRNFVTVRQLATIALIGLVLNIGTFSRRCASAADPRLQLEPGDHVAYIGNTMADRMQHDGWLETYLHGLFPRHQLTFRNLGFSADEIAERHRSANFGDPDQWLTKCAADVVFCFFGYNESLHGPAGLPKFRADLTAMIEGMRSQKYNGKSSPRLVLCSPIAHEDLHSRHLPDGTLNNRNLQIYTEAMREVCSAQDVPFVDLFTPTRDLYQGQGQPLTINGIHLSSHGNQVIAELILRDLFHQAPPESVDLARLRDAVLEKNYYWFSRYRVVDGYNVYGGRSTLAWHGQSNADVMRREMEVFDVMTANRDKRVWAVAQGGDWQVVDDNLPPLLEVKTNKPGPLEGERFSYLGGVEAIERMEVASGMEVNLFASEEMFPRLVNPVQMAVDTDSRLWASVWPSYPHWNPTEPRRDALVILPDEDGDGVADDCIVFADELNSVTGFEFWGGGVLVAAPPEIWFLKDTDGDDKADVKVRMLQGVSSADTHHSANAMLIGPDGWLYWSRGIFNVDSFETPTKTYRSGTSGVHRFNPRTFEVEFHFPIGPNPHGDVFDRWGYQFANDGTSGTGSYVNIGKGVGNKQWFEKRVRPVAATGILSSSHFPPENQGNFLICNTIGFLGVLQHEVSYHGADISATEIEPILVSSDQNFRPSDLEVGGDGALYVADWHNVLIGHMQHNMRDPNRDHEHGRIYRVTCSGRELLEPPKMKGQPIPAVCEFLFARENGTRYRARLELSGRDEEQVIQQVGDFAARLDPSRVTAVRDEAQALLECLWVFAEFRRPNVELISKVFRAEEPRVRAAAIRTLGQWGRQVEGGESILLAAARDPEPLVRAEAVKAVVAFDGLAAAEVVFEAATRPIDPELEVVLAYAEKQLNVQAIVQDAIRSSRQLSPAARAFALKHASVEDLLRFERSEAVCRAILVRPDADLDQLEGALELLAELTETSQLELLLDLIDQAQPGAGGNLSQWGKLLSRQSPASLRPVVKRLASLATQGTNAEVRRMGYAAWIAADETDEPFLVASRRKDSLRDFLKATSHVSSEIRRKLYARIRPLIAELPPHLSAEGGGADFGQSGLRVDYFYPYADEVSLERLADQQPSATGVCEEISIDVPLARQAERFALLFTAEIQVPESGNYTFYLSSDDGSRLYVGERQVVNNDGQHGMAEKSGSIELTAGAHPISVSYCNHTGGAGLQLAWEGPGFSKQPIPAERLTVPGGESLHDVAIEALASIPGHDADKFSALASLLSAGRHRAAAIRALRGLSPRDWPSDQVGPLIDNLLGYLSGMPARLRTGGSAVEAMALARALSSRLPAEEAQAIERRLESLDVRVIAIGTVPHRMIFDKERIAVAAGQPVEFRFANIDAMPHNFAIVQPGALQEVGELAEATGSEPDAMARHYIPKSDKILLASRLLQPGENQTLGFTAPTEPGVYPYVCTYPGHWRRMYGALYVVADYEAYQSDPEAYLASHPLPIADELLNFLTRDYAWTFDELIGDVRKLPPGRSFEVGKELFRAATCVGCHKLDNEGYVFGPDLAQLDEKKHTTEHILRSLLEPSRDIDAKYQAHTFLLESGLVVTGMIVETTQDEVRVMIDPLAKGEPTVIKKSQIEHQSVSEISPMPTGLLNRLTHEEILDLVAFVYAGGDPQAKTYHDGHHHHH